MAATAAQGYSPASPVFSLASPAFSPASPAYWLLNEMEVAPSARPPLRDKSKDYAEYKRHARAKHPKETRPLTLLRLPDELILRVFELLWNDYGEDCHVPPVEPLCLNKRIHALIRPLWFRTLTVPEMPDQFMTWLLRHQSIHQYVQDITIEFNIHSIHLHCLVTSQLHNLHTLRVDLGEYFEAIADDEVPPAFIKLLSELPLLRRLDLGAASIDPDFAFFLLSDKAPPLQHITCYGEVLDNDVLAALEIHSLKLESVPDNVVLPFLDLERLSLTSHRFNKNTYEKLLKSIKNETDRGEKPLKLRRLELDLQYKDPATGKQISLDTFYDHLLWTLRKSPLYTLNISLREPFSTTFKGYALPSVRGLRLSVDVNLSLQNKDHLSVLGSFLRLFPNLTHLKLHKVRICFGGLHCALTKYAQLDAAERALRYPHVAALLVFLHGTQVVDFRLASDDDEIRWTRRTAEGSFEIELWTTPLKLL